MESERLTDAQWLLDQEHERRTGMPPVRRSRTASFDDMLDRVTKAIEKAPIVSCRFNDWTEDHVPGKPIEIYTETRNGDIRILARYPGRRERDGIPYREHHQARQYAKAAMRALKKELLRG